MKASNIDYWLYGIHPCFAALQNKKRIIKKLFLTPNVLEKLKTEFVDNTINYEIVTKTKIEEILPLGCVHQGIAIHTSPLASWDFKDILLNAKERKSMLLLMLDQPNDSRNIGAILRSAAAFNVTAIIVPDRNTPREGGAMAKSAAGAMEIVPVVRVPNLIRSIKEFKSNGFWITGITNEAEMDIRESTPSNKSILILGSEGAGLRRLTYNICDFHVRIQMSQNIESLNISNAAAIALHHFSNKNT